MIKFSVNNFIGRVFYFFMGIFPFIFYLFLKTVFNWEFHPTLGVLLFFTIFLLMALLFTRFACLDWDFFIIKNEKFVFKRFKKVINININTPFIVKPIFLATLYFFTFKIVFQNGEVFYFRSKFFRRNLFTSLDEYAKRLEQEIKELAYRN